MFTFILNSVSPSYFKHFCLFVYTSQGRIQDFKLGGAHLGYFVWKITILRQKNHIFPILGGRAKFLGYFMWKITILRQKNHIFSNFRGGARAGCPPPPPPPESAPASNGIILKKAKICIIVLSFYFYLILCLTYFVLPSRIMMFLHYLSNWYLPLSWYVWKPFICLVKWWFSESL